MKEKRKILVLAAHPDDEVLGCGGTIARLAREGHAIYLGILGEGGTSRDTSTNVQKLHADCKKVCELLGAKKVVNLGFPDNRFDSIDLLTIVKKIEALIEEIHPEDVYTSHGGDLNIDHALTFRAVLTATRPMKGSTIRRVLAFEANSSTEWAFQKFSPGFVPNVFSDISTTLALKIQAMNTYESEVRNFPHPRSEEALRATALRWGSVAGVAAAEAFQLIWEVS